MLLKRLLLGPLGIVQPHGHGQIPIKIKLGLEEGIGLARGQPSENFVILLGGLLHGGTVQRPLGSLGELFHNGVRSILVHHEDTPARLGEIIAELTQGRHIGQHARRSGANVASGTKSPRLM